MTYIPYTYRIKNKTIGLQYYGVRYAKDCHPNDFWVTYFTSSKKVHKLIEKYGINDFEIKITKTFPNNPIKAITWEDKIVKKLLLNDNWLNSNWRGSIHPEDSKRGAILGAIKTNGGFLYTNGKEIKKFIPGTEPANWFRYIKKNRIDGIGAGTKNRKWFHNPKNPIEKGCFLLNESVPNSWVPGKGKTNRIKCFWYNNGKKEGQYEKDKQPKNWKSGRLKKLNL